MKNPLLSAIPCEEFDYQTLLDAVREYSQPRQKISSLLAKGLIVRVKKGLYVLGESQRRQPFCRELLANLIYGPSYISLEYALGYYGLIPERVETVTSVTCGRARSFATPVGIFSYKSIPLDVFSIGMDRVEFADGRSFLIGTPEKVLADMLVASRGGRMTTQRELRNYLFDDLRIDQDILMEMDPKRLAEIATSYRSRRVKLLADFISRTQRYSLQAIKGGGA